MLLNKVTQFLLLFHVFGGNRTTSGELIMDKFSRITTLDDIFAEKLHVLEHSSTKSIFGCVLLCINYKGCISVQYNIDKGCHLLHSTLSCPKGASEKGWTYYTKEIPKNIEASNDNPAFHVALSDEQSSPDIVRFKNIVTNIGNNYDNVTGKFTCRNPGLYIFSWSVKSVSEGQIQAHLFVNSYSVSYVASHKGGSETDISTNFAAVHLNVGDEAYICLLQTRAIGTGSTFSGWKHTAASGTCDVLFYGQVLKKRADSDVIHYTSVLQEGEDLSIIKPNSNGLLLLMTNTQVNRGLVSHLRYMMNGTTVMTSVIDGYPAADDSTSLVAILDVFENASIPVVNENNPYRITSIALTAMCIDTQGPAFSVALYEDADDIVYFSEALVNVGNVYNKTTGKFNVPKSGIYMVTWTINSYNDTDVTSGLFKNDDMIGHIKADSALFHHDVSTALVVLDLKFTDSLFVKILSGKTDSVGLYFSGFIIK